LIYIPLLHTDAIPAAMEEQKITAALRTVIAEDEDDVREETESFFGKRDSRHHFSRRGR
jgi:hypothetical protein